MMLEHARAVAILERMAGLNVLVVGDLMLDSYIIGVVDRISPEAPVPVVRVTEEREQPGGAANVAVNINSLGASSRVAGVLGLDHAGDRLARLLHTSGIDMQASVRTQLVSTVQKTRVIAERQQVVRFDKENGKELPAAVLHDLAAAVAACASGVDAVIVEDYGKGVVTETVVDAAVAGCRKSGAPIGLDPKDKHTVRIKGLTVATPNLAEACDAAGFPVRRSISGPEEAPFVERVGRTLLAKWKLEYLVVTLGSQGMTLFEPERAPIHLASLAREVFDVSGAGDTVIAVTVLALAAGATLPEAAFLANVAAGIVVGKLGAAACTATEIEKQICKQ